MAIPTLSVPRNYDNDRPWNKARVDEIINSIEAWSGQVATHAVDSGATETVTGWTFVNCLIDGPGSGSATLVYANSGSDRTITFPDPGASDEVVMKAMTQTLTSKTLTSPSITTPTITAPKVTTGSVVNKGTTSGGITFDLSLGNIQKVTLNGNGTFTFSNQGNFERFLIIVQQDGSGSRLVTWPVTVRWLNGTGATNSTTDKPTLTTTANKFDVISFYYDSDLSLFIGSIVGFKGAIT